jgi:hypothetical protein
MMEKGVVGGWRDASQPASQRRGKGWRMAAAARGHEGGREGGRLALALPVGRSLSLDLEEACPARAGVRPSWNGTEPGPAPHASGPCAA